MALCGVDGSTKIMLAEILRQIGGGQLLEGTHIPGFPAVHRRYTPPPTENPRKSPKKKAGKTPAFSNTYTQGRSVTQEPGPLRFSTALEIAQLGKRHVTASLRRFRRLWCATTTGAPAAMALQQTRLMTAFLIP